jgi:hypothetical protein
MAAEEIKKNKFDFSEEDQFNFILISNEIGKKNSRPPIYSFLTPEFKDLVEKTFDTDIKFNQDHLG